MPTKDSITIECPSGKKIKIALPNQKIISYEKFLSTPFGVIQDDAEFLSRLDYQGACKNLCYFARELHF